MEAMALSCSVANTESRKLWSSDRAVGLLSSPRLPLMLKLSSEKSHGRLLVREQSRHGIQCVLGSNAKGVASLKNSYDVSRTVGQLSHKLAQQATLERIRSARVIACLRCGCPELALEAARAALFTGIAVLEVTMTTPSAAQIIEVLAREYPSAVIGAGTVLSMQDALDATRAGAKFLASPIMVKEIVCNHRDGPVVVLPGARTPTEIASAYMFGAPAVKLFPVSLLGGVPYVRSASQLMSHIPLVVSQGCTLDMVDSYIEAGSMAVILSDAIFDKRALKRRDFDRIKALAHVAVSKGACSDFKFN